MAEDPEDLAARLAALEQKLDQLLERGPAVEEEFIDPDDAPGAITLNIPENATPRRVSMDLVLMGGSRPRRTLELDLVILGGSRRRTTLPPEEREPEEPEEETTEGDAGER